MSYKPRSTNKVYGKNKNISKRARQIANNAARMDQVEVIGEVSLAQRLAMGKNNAIDLTEAGEKSTDEKKLRLLRADLFSDSVSTSEEAIPIVRLIKELITASRFCLLSKKGVERLKRFLNVEELLNTTLRGMLQDLSDLCQSKVNVLQEEYRELGQRRVGLLLAQTSIISKVEETKTKVTKTQKKVIAAKKKVPIAEKLKNV